jgi:hypothetical protein
MDSDLALVLGIVIFALAIPSIISSFSEGRPPRLAMIFFVIGGGFITYAMNQSPNQYAFNDVPQTFVRVIGRLAH